MGAILQTVLDFLSGLFSKLSHCSKVGALVGGFSGFIFGSALVDGIQVSRSEAMQIGLILGVVGWVLALVLIGVLLRYGVRKTALLTLINALITSVAAVALLESVNTLAPYGFPVGILVGIVIGWLLCRLCEIFTTGVKGEAVR